MGGYNSKQTTLNSPLSFIICQAPTSKRNSGVYETGDYDARVISESFYDPLTGKLWPVEFSDWEDYKERSKRNTSQIAVLGYENMGKSFLLSRIMDRKLPQGKHTKTKGLCVLYPKDKVHPWTALDTPGTNISVKSEKVKKELKSYFESKKVTKGEIMRMLFGDNILMEALLQEFVILHAQVILVVVSKLRRDDQRLISRIKALPQKRVLIVHNLFDSTEVNNVKDIIRDDIFGTFDIRERHIQTDNDNENHIVYLENDDKAIEHIILAQEKSPAGKYYNQSAINYIRKVIDGCNYSNPFDLVQSFTKYVNENLRKYLSFNEETTTKEDDSFKLVKNEYGMPKSIRLKDYTQFDLKLSSANEFGDIKTYTKDGLESVPFTVKKVSEKNLDGLLEDFLKIEFEVVGSCSADELVFKIEELNDYARIMVIGKSKENVLEKQTEVVLQNSRRFGTFTIETEHIYIAGFTINRAERPLISQRVPGLVTIAFKLHKKIIN